MPNTWCAATRDTIDRGGSEWVQIDFGAGRDMQIESLMVQGRHSGSFPHMIKFAYQAPAGDWVFAHVGGTEEFEATEDFVTEGFETTHADLQFVHTLDLPARASKFRVYVLSYNQWPSLAFDLFGDEVTSASTRTPTETPTE